MSLRHSVNPANINSMTVPAWVCVLFLTVVQPVITQGETREECDVPAHVSSQAAVGKPPLRFSLSPLRDSLGLIEEQVTVEEQLYSTERCLLTLYLKSVEQEVFDLSLPLAGRSVTCFRTDRDSSVTGKGVATATVLKFLAHSIDRPEMVPASWYNGNRAVLAIAYNTFPNSTQESIRCKVSVDAIFFTVDLWIDVNTSFVGCPGTHWGKMCDDVCPCQNGGHCVNPFWVECLCPVGTSGQLCQNVTAAADAEAKYTRSRMGDSAVVTSNSPISSHGLSSQLPGKFVGATDGPIDKCDIPPRQSTLEKPGEGALQFFFRELFVNNVTGHPITLDKHLYEVNKCRVTLFVKLSVTIGAPTLQNLTLPSGVECQFLDSSRPNVHATVLYLFGATADTPRPAVLPQSWYSGNRTVVIQLDLNDFPAPSVTKDKLSCSYHLGKTLTFVFALGIDTQAVGCTKGLWGTTCQNRCQCEPEGTCHTFTGSCPLTPPLTERTPPANCGPLLRYSLTLTVALFTLVTISPL